MGSNARARILRVFIFNTHVFTVGQIRKRAAVSAKTAQKEIRTLERWGVIKKGKFSIAIGKSPRTVLAKNQKKEAWTANPNFRHAQALGKFIHEVSPVHHKNILLKLRKAGRISAIILSGSFLGDESRPADILLAADNINESRLQAAVRSLEPEVGRELRYAFFSTPEFRYRLTIQDRLIRDTLDYPHIVLLDKTRQL